MANIYIPDKLNNLLVKKCGTTPKEYVRELIEKDFKEKGWDKE